MILRFTKKINDCSLASALMAITSKQMEARMGDLVRTYLTSTSTHLRLNVVCNPKIINIATVRIFEVVSDKVNGNRIYT
jgi:hypothetical protein